MTNHSPLSPASDYDIVRAAIRHLSEAGPESGGLSGLARSVGMSERALGDLFRRWCGLSPKSFAQAVALDHAKSLLAEGLSVLDASNEVGLSSASRLHDLFIAYEAMPPGAFRTGAAGLDMVWGTAPSPFGTAVAVLSEYGLAGLGFADEERPVEDAFMDLARRWPAARFSRDDARVGPVLARVFDPGRWSADQPVRVVLIGTDFEVAVWETLLKIPLGKATSYSAVARHVGRPGAARAVGAAVGRNPISFVVPCHRVVGSAGALTGYHWGVPRKRAILGWEAGIVSSRSESGTSPDR